MSEERQIEVAITKLNQIARKVGTLPGGGPVAQDLILELVMEPVASFVEPYNNVIMSLSNKLGKNVAPLEIKNGSLMVVPEIYTNLFGTLIHTFRNSIDHGIELSDWRLENNKTEEGHIAVDFAVVFNHAQPYLLIRIQDDGQGINPDKIREKLKSNGVDASKESDSEVIQHIFDSEFSTRTEVTDISGRGVGMDAIRNAAELLAGRTWVESKVGEGTCICIEVPYLTEFDPSIQKTIPAKKAA
jgi:two-component system chemotaxis sensor kinase CheA